MNHLKNLLKNTFKKQLLFDTIEAFRLKDQKMKNKVEPQVTLSRSRSLRSGFAIIRSKSIAEANVVLYDALQ
jgi:hypothetical protein